MTKPSSDSNKLMSEALSEETRKVYQPPTLTMLDTYEIGTGATNVPEANSGLLES